LASAFDRTAYADPSFLTREEGATNFPLSQLDIGRPFPREDSTAGLPRRLNIEAAVLKSIAGCCRCVIISPEKVSRISSAYELQPLLRIA